MIFFLIETKLFLIKASIMAGALNLEPQDVLSGLSTKNQQVQHIPTSS